METAYCFGERVGRHKTAPLTTNIVLKNLFLCTSMSSRQKFLVISIIYIFFSSVVMGGPSKLPPRKNLHHISPPNWFIGFENNTLSLILHAENIESYTIELLPYKGVTLDTVMFSANRHIGYLELTINANTSPGELEFVISPTQRRSKATHKYSIRYELKNRKEISQQPRGISSNDVTYHLIIDRFCNENPDNDNANLTHNVKTDRTDQKARHGGDISGISSKLNYLTEMGCTSLWLSPVQLSDQPAESFNGQAITDHYEIDPRLGSNKEYLALCAESRLRGMKIIMDIMPNHLSEKHWMSQYFDTGWFNNRDSFIQNNFRSESVYDPYSSKSDKTLVNEGWVMNSMPDLNQRNQHIAHYLDQLYLWWVEIAQVDGYHIDSYPYSDQNYMNHLVELLSREYPKLTLFGGVQTGNTLAQASFVQNNIKGLEKNRLSGVSDFSLQDAFQHACSNSTVSGDGLNRVFNTLAEDIIYKAPEKNCTFLDNTSGPRFYSIANEDFELWKRGIVLLLTIRGLPCISYGTEILMTNRNDKMNAHMPTDFPGGWKGDPVNKFSNKGRTSKENEAFKWLQTLNKLRSSNPALGSGNTANFSAIDGIYTYFRYTKNACIMVVLSRADTETNIEMNRFLEITHTYTKMRNVQGGEILVIPRIFSVPAKGSLVFELLE